MYININGVVRGVAQPGRVLAWGARGRRFDSCHPDQNFKGNVAQIVEHCAENAGVIGVIPIVATK